MTTRDKEMSKNLHKAQVNRRKITHEWWLHHEMIKQKKDSPGRAKSQPTLGLVDMYKHRHICTCNFYGQLFF